MRTDWRNMNTFTMNDLGHLIAQLWRNKWLILFVTLAGLTAGMALTVNDEPEINYRATSSVCVTYTTYQEQMRGSSVITSYSELVASQLVCRRAADLLEGSGLSPADIRGMIDNSVSSNSYIMNISATSVEPQGAITVANAVAEAFVEEVSTVSGNNTLQILDVAHSTVSIESGVSVILIAAALGPFIIVCVWIALREVYNGKVRFLSQCAAEKEELLGVLPDVK